MLWVEGLWLCSPRNGDESAAQLSYKWSVLVRSGFVGFDQYDVTTTPKGKVELWLCNEVQGSIKTMVKLCIDNLLEDIEVGHS